MKQIKLMLIVLMVLAIVGGAIAFKIEHFSLVYCIASTHNNIGRLCNEKLLIEKPCTGATQFYYTTLQADGVSPILSLTDCSSLPCPSTTLCAGEE